MAVCPSCGKTVRDDIWVCGHCGALLVRAGSTTPTGVPRGVVASSARSAGRADQRPAGPYGAMAGTDTAIDSQPVLTSVAGYPIRASRTGGASRPVLITTVLGFVAVVAIVAVWFFALRDVGGDITPFVGRWRLDVPGSTITQSFVISDTENGPRLSLTVSDGAQPGATQMAGPFKLELDGDRVCTTFEPADNASEELKIAAEMIRSAYGAMIDDFKLVFSKGPSTDTVTLSIEGDLTGGAGSLSSLGGQTVELTRVGDAP